MRTFWQMIGVAFAAIFANFSVADTLTFTSGGKLSCSVIKDGKDEVLVLMDNALVPIPKSSVRKVSLDKPTTAKPSAPTAVERRIPGIDEYLRHSAEAKWCEKLRQIPAFVIDRGVMRHVPYKSFRSGDWEVNLYGDPENPSGFEIGIYNARARDDSSRNQCREFISSLLTDAADREALVSLKDTGGEVTRDGWTIEITPATAEDAYGAWWVSVYDAKALDKVRATEKELEEISEKVRASETKSTPPESTTPKPESEQKPSTERESTPSTPSQPVTVPSQWSTAEYSAARKAPPSNTGRVYVRGYYRKDGSYVRPHSRRR